MGAVSGAILGVLLLLVLFGPRRWALVALLASVFFLTQGHAVNVAGVTFFPTRILGAVAAFRVMARRELRLSSLNRLDAAVLGVYNYAAVVWMLRSSTVEGQQLASAVDPTLAYLAFRGLIQERDDMRTAMATLAWLLVPFTAAVLTERLSGHSAFVVVGALDELLFRNGVARGQGSFRHAILLGSVAASLLAIFVALCLDPVRRRTASLGAVLCVCLIALTNSGGPVTSLMAAVAGWAIWLVRRRLRLIRRLALLGLLALALLMKAPIWYLPFKVSGIVGGGGYHRGLLMERAWENLAQWWLAGMRFEDTAGWFPYVLDAVGGADVTNQFLAIGLRAGLPALMLFVVTLWLAFRRLGSALTPEALEAVGLRADALLAWGLGVALFVHVVSWVGVSYFDQSHMIWMLHLAAVAGPIGAVPVALGTPVHSALSGAQRRRWAGRRPEAIVEINRVVVETDA